MTWGDCVYVVVYQIETTLEFNSVQNILWAWIKEKKMSSLISNYLLAFISSTWNVPMHCNVWDSIAYLKNAELWGTTPLFTISIVSLNFIFIFSSNHCTLHQTEHNGQWTADSTDLGWEEFGTLARQKLRTESVHSAWDYWVSKLKRAGSKQKSQMSNLKTKIHQIEIFVLCTLVNHEREDIISKELVLCVLMFF